MRKTPSREDDGYTLTEMLAALLIIGLTTGGLVEGGYAISRLQATSAKRVQAFTAARSTQARFAALMDGRGPFRSAGSFDGEGETFSFACGEHTCGASLEDAGAVTTLQLRTPAVVDVHLANALSPRFAYVGSGPAQDTWPPRHGEPQRLKAILLLSGGPGREHALASAPVWRQEEAACRFDAIAKDCRAGPS